MPNRAQCIETYLRAKDENRPHLMKSAFAWPARLEVLSETDAISFPPATSGLDAITKVLVRDFALEYENVYTFCLTEAPTGRGRDFQCAWLVGMSEKTDGSVRVGCGQYAWSFQKEEPNLVDRLVITIDLMKVLPQDALDPIVTWLTALPYPWCPAPTAITAFPKLGELSAVRDFLAKT